MDHFDPEGVRQLTRTLSRMSQPERDDLEAGISRKRGRSGSRPPAVPALPTREGTSKTSGSGSSTLEEDERFSLEKELQTYIAKYVLVFFPFLKFNFNVTA